MDVQVENRNAIILAAGTSSRFVPLSIEKPKGLLEVNGEVLIERQIHQLMAAGIEDITLVLGYKREMFEYLSEKYHVDIVYNEDYNRYNNTSSLIRVLDRLGNTFICCSDNYFPENVFSEYSKISYYSSLYAEGKTNEYCLRLNAKGIIEGVSIGGTDSWYMIGHVFFSKDFSNAFKEILRKEYENEDVRHGYWEDVFIRHIAELPAMAAKKYDVKDIKEFDSLEELRLFDSTYIKDTRSLYIKRIARILSCDESELGGFKKVQDARESSCFSFSFNGNEYFYNYIDNKIEII